MKTRSVTSRLIDSTEENSDTEQISVTMQDRQSGDMGGFSGVTVPKQAIVSELWVGSKAQTCHGEHTASEDQLPRNLSELDHFVNICHSSRSSLRCFEELIAPLITMLNDDEQYEWTVDARSAYAELSSQLRLMKLGYTVRSHVPPPVITPVSDITAQHNVALHILCLQYLH